MNNPRHNTNDTPLNHRAASFASETAMALMGGKGDFVFPNVIQKLATND
jgi:hypothetical protein